MGNNNSRIVFMGTPDFAVESLKKLLEKGKNIVAVVTAPDKPAGRGRELAQSAVKQFAIKNHLPVLQPEKLKDPIFVQQISQLNPSLIVVVAFRMLPKLIWDIPSYGTINLHASLLPQYRGAAPINWAIINGETVTGVTTFFIEEAIDTGKILLQKKIPVLPGDNAGSLHDKLMNEGSILLDETVDGILAGKLTSIEQSELIAGEGILHPAPKITREMCRIDWNQSLENIHNLVRGMSPYPSAWTELIDDTNTISNVKIFATSIEKAHNTLQTGKILTDGKTWLKVAHREGYLSILTIQIPGKKQLQVNEFLKGFRFIGEPIFR